MMHQPLALYLRCCCISCVWLRTKETEINAIPWAHWLGTTLHSFYAGQSLNNLQPRNVRQRFMKLTFKFAIVCDDGRQRLKTCIELGLLHSVTASVVTNVCLRTDRQTDRQTTFNGQWLLSTTAMISLHIIIIIISNLQCTGYKIKIRISVHNNCQFDKIVQLTKSSAKK